MALEQLPTGQTEHTCNVVICLTSTFKRYHLSRYDSHQVRYKSTNLFCVTKQPQLNLDSARTAPTSVTRYSSNNSDPDKLALLTSTRSGCRLGRSTLSQSCSFRYRPTAAYRALASFGWPPGHTGTMASGPSEKKPEKSYLASAVDSINPWSGSRSSTPTPKDPQPKPAALNPGDHTTNPFYGQSFKKYPSDCPPLKVQWFHAVDVSILGRARVSTANRALDRFRNESQRSSGLETVMTRHLQRRRRNSSPSPRRILAPLKLPTKQD